MKNIEFQFNSIPILLRETKKKIIYLIVFILSEINWK